MCATILGAAIVDLHGRELMSLCAIYHKNQQFRVNQLTTQKSLHYLATQNKSLDITNVLVALGPAEWIFKQHFMSAVENLSSILSHIKEIGAVDTNKFFRSQVQLFQIAEYLMRSIIIEINAHIPTQEAQGILLFVRLFSFLLSDAIIRARVHSLKKFLFYVYIFNI
ncbi:hypothetical protein RFI_37773 [Reticulomyxa filosa]|uniref:Uncharacterized protein n=1 Tax=Reticulomyxa filosa TaxID=46433 RepID=X6LCD6_RETFI|nr:hypothetical protein RFI_37773 [Reticulomyxa filosa]|eukprot:ETN99697.1 hypothetical protein RFI_37773 [Reticulomyxa filosa]